MNQENLKRVAKLLINHSLELKENEKVFISAYAGAKNLVIELLEEAYRIGAYPYVELNDNEVMKTFIKGANVEQINIMNDWNMQRYKDVDAVIGIEGEENDAEYSEIPPEHFGKLVEATRSSNEFMENNRRWVIFKYPTLMHKKQE